MKNWTELDDRAVAIARALATNPPIMLCDEPTASLDNNSAHTVMEELKNLAKGGKALGVVTHDMRLKPYADEIIYVAGGEVSKTEINQTI
jgi:putative ABC transport system ATP-binding protein